MSNTKMYFCSKMNKSVCAEGAGVFIIIRAEKTAAIFYKTSNVDACVDSLGL